jgi:hypothetical protein
MGQPCLLKKTDLPEYRNNDKERTNKKQVNTVKCDDIKKRNIHIFFYNCSIQPSLLSLYLIYGPITLQSEGFSYVVFFIIRSLFNMSNVCSNSHINCRY